MKHKVFLFAITFICSLVFVLAPSVIHAETPNVIDWIDEEETPTSPVNEEEPTAENNEKSFAVIIGQLLLYTLIIIILIYGLIKFLALRQKKLQPNQAVQLLGGTTLGSNKSLQIVKIGGKMYLLGVADSINLIKEFSSEAEIKQIEQDLAKQPFTISKSMFGFAKGKAHNSNDDQTNQAFQQLFNQSLSKQKRKQDQFKSELENNNEEKEGRS